MGRFLRVMLMVLLLVSIGAALFGQIRNPMEKIQLLKADAIPAAPGTESTISFTLSVPENHHLYLEHVNPASYSILMKVSVENTPGIRLVDISKPEGEREGDDMVLRGSGEFSLRLSFDSPFSSGDVLKLPVTIYGQLCNDETEVCYPPYIAQRSITLKFTEGSASREEEQVSSTEIEWQSSIDRGKQEAARTGKSMFVFITAPSWCGACMSMEEYTLPDPSFITFINKNFIPVLVPDEIGGATNQDLFVYDFGWAYPSYLLVTPDGDILYKDAGFVSAEQLISELSSYTDDSAEYDDAADVDWGGITYTEMLELQENYKKNHARQYTKKSTAAFLYAEDVGCAILDDGRFVLWSLDDRAQVIEGFPKSIEDYWPDLYPYRNKVLSALTLPNGKYYLFLDDGTYLRFTYGTRALDPGYPKKISDNTWPGLAPYASRIQASFFYPRQDKVYFFLDRKEYLRYDFQSDSLDYGYPKPINESTWEGLEAYARIILSALNGGGDISYIFTYEGNMMEFSHTYDRVIKY